MAFLLIAFVARAEVVDRIAASVGNRVITASDLDREIRVTAFLNGTQPDISPAAKRATAERLVDQSLIRRELENSRYPAPSPADVAPAIEQFKREHYPNEAEYQRALAAACISDQDVKDEVLWQRTLLQFINERFRAGVQVMEQEIQDYFDKVVKPAAEAAHTGQPVRLEDYHDKIEETLAGPRVDRSVETWLQGARRRTEIVYHDEVFQ